MNADSESGTKSDGQGQGQCDRRPFLKSVGATLIAGGLAGCTGDGGNGNGNSGTTGNPSSGNLDEVSMTVASAFSDNHVLIAGAAQRFKEIVEAESDENFTVQIAPGGSYGAEDEISNLVAEGGVEAHSQGTFPFLQYAPKYAYFMNPFVMTDYEHLKAVHESDLMGPGYEQVISKGNQRPLGQMVYRGKRHLCTKKGTGAVQTPDGIQGLTLRVSEIPPWVKIFSKIGFDTAAIAWTEVYSALQQGVADALEAPVGALNSASLYEVFDVLNITGHQITTGNIYINESFYQGLDLTYQDIVQQAGDKATAHATQMAQKDEQSLIETFKNKHGIKINRDADRAAFASSAEPAIQKLFENQWAHTWEDVRNV